MEEEIKTTLTFKLLRALGFNYSIVDYGQVTLCGLFKQVWLNFYHKLLMNMMDWAILEPINPRKLRPALLRAMGAKVGKDVYIGAKVFVDMSHADLIEIGDHTHITNRTVLLCHKHDLSNYCVGDDYAELPYMYGKIVIGKGCSTGTDSIIMPGVNIGDGAIIGAGSLVTKDIPAWTIAVGRPAKVIREIPKRVKE